MVRQHGSALFPLIATGPRCAGMRIVATPGLVRAGLQPSLRRVFAWAQARRTSPLAPSASEGSPTRSTNARPSSSGTPAPLPQPTVLVGPSNFGTAVHSVSTSSSVAAVHAATTISDMSAPDAGDRLTQHRIALSQRSLRAQTPYRADTWQELLAASGLLEKYRHVPDGLRFGFDLNIPSISKTQSPPNKESIIEYSEQFHLLITLEIQKGRYLGPFTAADIESLIGPFQTSPFSIIPKTGRPGLFRLLQNFSYPHDVSIFYSSPSINSTIDSHDFPCSWGTFNILCLVIIRLPPHSQAATRDVAEGV